jgi:hypothetical protein
MTRALFEMNVAITQLNKAVSFMTMATFMTVPNYIFGEVVQFGGNLITFFTFIIFDLFTLPLSYLYMSPKL